MVIMVHRRFLLLITALAAVVLAACSPMRELSVSQQEFQGYINNGFTAPRIVTVDLPASARAHLYLDTPQVTFADSRRKIDWVIPGEVDVDFAGQISSGRMSIVLQGRAELVVQPDEKSVSLTKVSIEGKDIAVQSSLVQMLVLDALAEIVAGRLNNLLLFTAPDGSPFAGFVENQDSVGYQIEPGHIVFKTGAVKDSSGH